MAIVNKSLVFVHIASIGLCTHARLLSSFRRTRSNAAELRKRVESPQKFRGSWIRLIMLESVFIMMSVQARIA